MENKHVEYDDSQYYEPLVYYNYGEFNYDDISGFFIEDLTFKFSVKFQKLKINIKGLDN